MDDEKNELLEYVFDTLLKTFNPDRKPIMKRLHFFKMMDLLDSRLKIQNIDIKYPSYWYKYGAVADFSTLDMVIPHGFRSRYYANNENVLFPYPARRTYNIDKSVRRTIDQIIKMICGQYKYKSDYGTLLKKDSYKINSPYKYNTIFQDYINAVDNQNSVTSKVEILESLLDKLLHEFPEDDYPELIDINLEWDDTTRLVLSSLEGMQQRDITKSLMNIFWDLYSKGIRIKHNQNIPDEMVDMWAKEYENTLPIAYEQIESIRKNVLLSCDNTFKTEDVFVKKILQKAHDIAFKETLS